MQKYMLLVFLWEDRYVDPENAAIKTVECVPQELNLRVYQEASVSAESVLQVGVFWPKQLALAKFGKIDKKAWCTHVHDGVSLRGVVTVLGEGGGPHDANACLSRPRLGWRTCLPTAHVRHHTCRVFSVCTVAWN